MMRTTLATLLTCTVLLGCKGEKVVQIDPSTKASLDDCEKKRQALADLNKTLSDENAKLLREKAGSGEIVIALEGNLMTVKPPKPGAAPPIDEKAARAAAMEFQNVVEKSRGAIQKCYEQALKRQTVSQAKTVTLSVSATFSSNGVYQSASFNPPFDDAFNTCLRQVAQKWSLPQNSPAMTFRAQVSLTPT